MIQRQHLLMTTSHPALSRTARPAHVWVNCIYIRLSLLDQVDKSNKASAATYTDSGQRAGPKNLSNTSTTTKSERMAAIPGNNSMIPFDNVVMGVPKKGRLYDRCMKLLAGAGMDHRRVSGSGTPAVPLASGARFVARSMCRYVCSRKQRYWYIGCISRDDIM